LFLTAEHPEGKIKPTPAPLASLFRTAVRSPLSTRPCLDISSSLSLWASCRPVQVTSLASSLSSKPSRTDSQLKLISSLQNYRTCHRKQLSPRSNTLRLASCADTRRSISHLQTFLLFGHVLQLTLVSRASRKTPLHQGANGCSQGSWNGRKLCLLGERAFPDEEKGGEQLEHQQLQEGALGQRPSSPSADRYALPRIKAFHQLGCLCSVIACSPSFQLSHPIASLRAGTTAESPLRSCNLPRVDTVYFAAPANKIQLPVSIKLTSPSFAVARPIPSASSGVKPFAFSLPERHNSRSCRSNRTSFSRPQTDAYQQLALLLRITSLLTSSFSPLLPSSNLRQAPFPRQLYSSFPLRRVHPDQRHRDSQPLRPFNAHPRVSRAQRLFEPFPES
jgi:hypothetical protein